jgi:hypothetical protein
MTTQNPLRVMLEARCEEVGRRRRGEEGGLEAASASFNLVRATSAAPSYHLHERKYCGGEEAQLDAKYNADVEGARLLIQGRRTASADTTIQRNAAAA